MIGTIRRPREQPLPIALMTPFALAAGLMGLAGSTANTVAGPISLSQLRSGMLLCADASAAVHTSIRSDLAFGAIVIVDHRLERAASRSPAAPNEAIALAADAFLLYRPRAGRTSPRFGRRCGPAVTLIAAGVTCKLALR
jgi:hypothetical protein